MLPLFVLCIASQALANHVFNDKINMVQLDRNISNNMLEPQPGGGPKLLEDAKYFHLNMDAAADLAEANDKRGEALYLDIMRDGGPGFVKRSFFEDELIKAFKWGPDEIEELRALQGAVENDWKRLEDTVIKNA